MRRWRMRRRYRAFLRPSELLPLYYLIVASNEKLGDESEWWKVRSLQLKAVKVPEHHYIGVEDNKLSTALKFAKNAEVFV